ncbi:MAG: LPS export ABC transporter periplasmic protein LptC [Betaproteobacteria bacterium]|jgi:lipopolysaccharide export system protein LptC|nr:LPS export ABC transporter periplasmic protein LptC [Betaproteobacteria bacterium]
MIGTLRYALDRLTLYLPAVLMAMFALGSWWLVRSLPSFVVAPTEKILRHEPDYFLHNFSIQSFDAEGRLTRELQGDQARHFPDTDMLDINAVQLQSQNPQGQRMHASAARALAKSDGTEVSLIGTALVQRDALRGGVRTELRSEHLTAFVKEDRVVSHSPVEFKRGSDVFTANALEMNSRTGQYQLLGKVRGVVQAQTP